MFRTMIEAERSTLEELSNLALTDSSFLSGTESRGVGSSSTVYGFDYSSSSKKQSEQSNSLQFRPSELQEPLPKPPVNVLHNTLRKPFSGL